MSLRQQTKQGGGEGAEDAEAVDQKKPFPGQSSMDVIYLATRKFTVAVRMCGKKNKSRYACVRIALD